jgi:hypothetical protein
MSISVTPSYGLVETSLVGAFINSAQLTLTGLSSGSDNTVPHGLPRTPVKVTYIPRDGNGNWYETSAADATNLYITSGSSGPTSFIAYVEY